MNISITARHCEISEELRERTRQVLERLGTLVRRPLEAAVVFDVGPQVALAEIRLKRGRSDVLVATGQDKDHRSALDRAVDKIRRQVERDDPTSKRRGARELA
ncbi:MAG TPA: HPF/RaiA family ribosome-associated protein [Gemmatimonadales bacterium]|jgi:ribosomal subunit interface protein|nr:HPF/RaiA family ribosome-associated protein [Gemmatimonadales bacterium]